MGGTFVFEPGPDYDSARASEMDHPFRVVLDFAKKGGPKIPEAGDLTTTRREPSEARGVRTIILDPGHGGNEVGAQGPTGLAEKDVVLEIARRVARHVRQDLGLEVVMTRSTDKVIALDERAGVANNRQGDLFVSIHANASRGARASGAETYFVALDASDAEAESLAADENLAMGLPFGPEGGNGELDMVLWEMAQAEHRIESFLLAETIQRELNELLDTRDRGVRQAPFRVLMGVAMPAVLVEVAFISNPDEEEALRTPDFQEKIAEAIARSIASYKISYEQRTGLVEQRDRALGRGGS